jgi:Flp pilus assembly protein TadG
MMIQRKAALTRRGGVLVAIALVMILMTTFVFGIFEYSRLMMDWNLLKNAAREGCRYAIANNTSTTISTSVQTIVTK